MSTKLVKTIPSTVIRPGVIKRDTNPEILTAAEIQNLEALAKRLCILESVKTQKPGVLAAATVSTGRAF